MAEQFMRMIKPLIIIDPAKDFDSIILRHDSVVTENSLHGHDKITCH